MRISRCLAVIWALVILICCCEEIARVSISWKSCSCLEPLAFACLYWNWRPQPETETRGWVRPNWLSTPLPMTTCSRYPTQICKMIKSKTHLLESFVGNRHLGCGLSSELGCGWGVGGRRGAEDGRRWICFVVDSGLEVWFSRWRKWVSIDWFLLNCFARVSLSNVLVNRINSTCSAKPWGWGGGQAGRWSIAWLRARGIREVCQVSERAWSLCWARQIDVFIYFMCLFGWKDLTGLDQGWLQTFTLYELSRKRRRNTLRAPWVKKRKMGQRSLVFKPIY